MTWRAGCDDRGARPATDEHHDPGLLQSGSARNELLPLYDAAEMRALDAAAIDLGIPAAVLMERAGLAAAHEIMSRFPDCRRFAIVARAGNNGRDGFALGRHLLAPGRRPPGPLTGAAAMAPPGTR